MRTAQIPTRAVAFRANNFDRFNDIKYNSVDSYARTRSLYYQMRAGTLHDNRSDGQTPTAADDQFDAFFDGEWDDFYKQNDNKAIIRFYLTCIKSISGRSLFDAVFFC